MQMQSGIITLKSPCQSCHPFSQQNAQIEKNRKNEANISSRSSGMKAINMKTHNHCFGMISTSRSCKIMLSPSADNTGTVYYYLRKVMKGGSEICLRKCESETKQNSNFFTN